MLLVVITITTMEMELIEPAIRVMSAPVTQGLLECVRSAREFVWMMGVHGESVNFSPIPDMYKNIVRIRSIMTVMDKLMKDVIIHAKRAIKFPVILHLKECVQLALGRVCRTGAVTANVFRMFCPGL